MMKKSRRSSCCYFASFTRCSSFFIAVLLLWCRAMTVQGFFVTRTTTGRLHHPPPPRMQFSTKETALPAHSSHTAATTTTTFQNRSTHDVAPSTWLSSHLQQEKRSSASSTTTMTTDTTADDDEINRARLLLVAAAALYGTNFGLVKLLDQTVPVGAAATLRFGMAALATLPWLWPNTGKDKDDNDVAWAATCAGAEVGFWTALGYVAQAVGLETTLASKSAFLCSLAVVVVPLLDYFLDRKILQSRQLVGTLLALIGVGVLELGGLQSHELGLSTGDLASLLQPLAFGMGFWRMEAAMHKYPDQAHRTTAAQLLAVFVASALYCGVTDPASLELSQVTQWLTDPTILFALFWTGVITTALTVYMETVALKTLSAAETTLIFSTEPLWGTAFAAAVMGEQLGMDSAVGAVLILSGCLFSNLGMDGIRSLLDNSAVSAKNDTIDNDNTMSGFNPIVDGIPLFRVGLAATIGKATAGAWNHLSVGTKVMAFQLQDLLEDMLPRFFIDNH